MDWTKVIKEIQILYAEKTSFKDFGYESVAKLCGVSKGYIYKLATGKSKNPSYEIAQKLLALHRGEVEPLKTKRKSEKK